MAWTPEQQRAYARTYYLAHRDEIRAYRRRKARAYKAYQHRYYLRVTKPARRAARLAQPARRGPGWPRKTGVAARGSKAS